MTCKARLSKGRCSIVLTPQLDCIFLTTLTQTNPTGEPGEPSSPASCRQSMCSRPIDQSVRLKPAYKASLLPPTRRLSEPHQSTASARSEPLGCLLLQVIFGVPWTGSEPTGFQDMRLATGGAVDATVLWTKQSEVTFWFSFTPSDQVELGRRSVPISVCNIRTKLP